MAKLHLQTLAPLGIIAVTLISVAVITFNKPNNLSVSTSNSPIAIEERTAKPGAQVSLVSLQTQTLELNQPTEIVLTLLSQHKAGTLSVDLIADDALYLGSEQDSWTFELSAGQTELHLPITVTSTKDGLHYVNIFAQYTNDEGERLGRALAAEFKTGVGAVSSAKHFAKDTRVTINQTQSIIALPSKEFIF